MPEDESNTEEESTLEERTIESLMRHGFPLEIETHQILDIRGWKSWAERAFKDSDEDTTRRIDFVAWKKQNVVSKFFKNAMIVLAIECKKRENSSWVFYRTRKAPTPPNDIDALIEKSPFMLVLGEPKWLDAFGDNELQQIILCSHQLSPEHPFEAIAGHDIPVETDQERHQRKSQGSKGKSGKKQDDDRSDFLYRASLVVTKALEAELDADVEVWSESLSEGQRLPDDFEVYYPVVVFDGPMYEAKIQSGEVVLTRVSYVQLKWEGEEYGYVIDVVSKDYLNEYLDILDEELARLGKAIESLQDIWDRVLNRIRATLIRKS